MQHRFQTNILVNDTLILPTFSLTLLARSSSILSWMRFLRYSSNAKGSAIDLAWEEI